MSAPWIKGSPAPLKPEPVMDTTFPGQPSAPKLEPVAPVARAAQRPRGWDGTSWN